MKKDKREISIVRSSAAEYLTFITATGESDVNAVYCDENVWLTQKMMGLLYNVETHTINYHLKKIFADGEIDENSVIRKFRITAADGKTYNTNHYNLSAIIAVGNKVDSPRAVQFRKWANRIIEEFTVKGFAMDDERLKNGGTILTKDYFKEQLERIREIRLSERRFYQKITDIYATSIDYDAKAETTRLFFARVQNQLHWAIHGETAAETIYRRADSSKEHMGLTTWKDAPNGKIQKFDVVIAKNYLTQEELSAMARIVNAYLDLAELRAEEQVPMTMEDWAEQFEGVLRLSRKEILTNAGSISAKIAEQHALSEFEKYRIVQDQLYQSDFDRILLEKDSYINELPETKDGGE
ncbi:virulence RhuM family protein [Faecalibacterium sp.]|uniref:virulence RhuM family protein n=1 Tax=Faecalibacterium sp. TaxID=1971605 RepID=UPI0025C2509B|nr:virulence RhuM family protein [Faecalibacterium sp.]